MPIFVGEIGFIVLNNYIMKKIFNLIVLCCLLMMYGCSTNDSLKSGMLVVKVSPSESGKLFGPMLEGNSYSDESSSYVSSISSNISFGDFTIKAIPNVNSFFASLPYLNNKE